MKITYGDANFFPQTPVVLNNIPLTAAPQLFVDTSLTQADTNLTGDHAGTALFRIGGFMTAAPGAITAGFPIESKLSLSGFSPPTDPGVYQAANPFLESRIEVFYTYEPTAVIHRDGTYDDGIIASANFVIHGNLAAGDTALVAVSAGTINPFDERFPFGFGGSWNLTAPGPFDLVVSGSQLLGGAFGHSEFATIQHGFMVDEFFQISRVQGGNGTSWISFSDPEASVQAVQPQAVPEPGTLTLWTIAAALICSPALRRRRTTVR